VRLARQVAAALAAAKGAEATRGYAEEPAYPSKPHKD